MISIAYYSKGRMASSLNKFLLEGARTFYSTKIIAFPGGECTLRITMYFLKKNHPMLRLFLGCSTVDRKESSLTVSKKSCAETKVYHTVYEISHSESVTDNAAVEIVHAKEEVSCACSLDPASTALKKGEALFKIFSIFPRKVDVCSTV